MLETLKRISPYPPVARGMLEIWSSLRGASHRPVWNAWVARSYNPPAQSAGDRHAGRMSRDALVASFHFWHSVNTILCEKCFEGPNCDMNPNITGTKWFHDLLTLAWRGHEHVTIVDKSDSVCLLTSQRMDEQLTLEEILREGMIGSPNHQLHSDDLQRAAERGDTEGKISWKWYERGDTEGRIW